MLVVLLRYWPQILAAVVVSTGSFLLGAAITQPFAYAAGEKAGRLGKEAEIAAAAAQAEKERVQDDVTIRGLDDYDLCARGMRRQRLPVDSCDVLRGLPAE